MLPHCPRCHSRNVKVVDEELGLLQCQKCHYNELEEATVPETRKTQREKGKYSPYQQGGKRRVQKN
ncbi:MAG: hypothetical protein AABX13_03195 [Nanoarchaeota archaeon]